MDIKALSEMIYKRRSVRKYKKELPGAEVLEGIREAMGATRAL